MSCVADGGPLRGVIWSGPRPAGSGRRSWPGRRSRSGRRSSPAGRAPRSGWCSDSWPCAASSSCLTTCHQTSRLPSDAPTTRNDDEQDEHPTTRDRSDRASVGRARSAIRSAGRDDEGLGELLESEVDGVLADGRLAPRRLRSATRSVWRATSRRLLVGQTVDVVAGGRDADALGEREEGQQEGEGDAAEQDPDPARMATRAGGRARPSAAAGRGGLDGPGGGEARVGRALAPW